MPATAATSATVAHASSISTIPFGQPAAASVPTSAGSLLIATALLGIAFVVLWWLRRRGYMAVASSVAGERGGYDRLAVTQRLRLSPTCSAFVLLDGHARLLVVESRHGVQVSALAPAERAT